MVRERRKISYDIHEITILNKLQLQIREDIYLKQITCYNETYFVYFLNIFFKIVVKMLCFRVIEFNECNTVNTYYFD